jgi:hypothetical protein
MEIREMATKLAKFESLSGRATEKQILRIIKQFTGLEENLQRMLKERKLI